MQKTRFTEPFCEPRFFFAALCLERLKQDRAYCCTLIKAGKRTLEIEWNIIKLVEVMGLAFGLADGFPLLQRVETGLLLYLQFADYLAARLTPDVRSQCDTLQMKLQDLMGSDKKIYVVQSIKHEIGGAI